MFIKCIKLIKIIYEFIGPRVDINDKNKICMIGEGILFNSIVSTYYHLKSYTILES
jgi:hypothetical protein